MASQKANCAKAIKTEIKTLFPTAKISATSDNNSVNVKVIGISNFEDRKAIENLCEKYEFGHFNGMEDIYEYSNIREDIPQVKYVFVQFSSI